MTRPGAPRANVADRLAAIAVERPDAVALAAADGRGGFRTSTLAELNADAETLAHGLGAMGIGPGKRIALLVKPGIEFVTLVFALLRSGATMVLVDAGLGRKNLVRCLASTEPDGFVAIPIGHVMRRVKRKHFPSAKLNVTVGRRWFWGGETLESLRKLGEQESPSPLGGGARGGGEAGTRNPPTTTLPHGGRELPHTTADDPAAIAFTSGSTGPPKGVLYTHEMFVTQCDEIQREYDIRPGDIDLACFPLFGLFNVACGVTVVLPEMDFSRPASCDPKKLLAAANQWKVNQAFASPAVWDRVSRHCETTGESIPTLRKVLSCGAPVPAKVLRRTLTCVHPEATMHTPYGATESLPVATIEAQEVLNETAAKTDEGAGVCVGRKFGSMQKAVGSRQNDGEPSTPVIGGFDYDWRVIRISDDPIRSIDETDELPPGEIGELIVRGPQVSTAYSGDRAVTQADLPLSDEQQHLKDEFSDFVARGIRGELQPHEMKGGLPYFGRKLPELRPIGHNRMSKIPDGPTIWHRIGDVGYFDEQERFWYCGRKSQRVGWGETALYTECVEQVCTAQPHIEQAALVVVQDGQDVEAVLVINGVVGDTNDMCDIEVDQLLQNHSLFNSIKHWLMYPGPLPTDIRHNSKIRREELAVWAAKQLRKR